MRSHRPTWPTSRCWVSIPPESPSRQPQAVRQYYIRAGLAALRQYIEAARADVVVLDPLASVIPVGLNDNGLIAGLMAQLKVLAVERDFALLIIHHFKKGADGSAEGVGGASAIVNHARAVFTVEAMGEREAASFGIMPSERWRLLRLADLKLNLAPRARRDGLAISRQCNPP